jgi:hypothetical protein
MLEKKRPSKLGRASLGGSKLDDSSAPLGQRKPGGSNSNLFEPQINFQTCAEGDIVDDSAASNTNFYGMALAGGTMEGLSSSKQF